ncbi:MAG: pyridoxamine 5'-phosphate oxidase family protein [Candidatus Helarchaeota archaeon]
MSEKKNSKDVLEKAITYLESHNLLTMATATKDGNPHAACLEYANKGMDVYVSTWMGSRKLKNIQNNPRVFYEVHDVVNINKDDLKKIKGLQVEATGEILQYPSQKFQDAWEIMMKKFPVFKLIKLNDKRAILHFKPKKLWMLDYSIKFGHTDKYEF